VTSVKYTTAQGDEMTFAPENYIVNTAREPGKLVLRGGAGWPDGELEASAAIRVQYVCGWDEAAKIPPNLVHAVRLMCGHLYENREVVVVGTTAAQIPTGIDALIDPFRLLRF